MEENFKPHKLAFIVSRVARDVLFFAVILASLYLFLRFVLSLSIESSYFLSAILLFSGLALVWESVVFRKLSFTFAEAKIIQKGGTIFSDYETELSIRNITHLRLRKPWLEHYFFRTAHIDIESAGASSSEIHLCSMLDFERIHSLVMDLMRQNGFQLEKKELVLTEKPDQLGVFFETIGNLIKTFFLIVLFVALSTDDKEEEEMVIEFIIDNGWFLLPLLVLPIVIYHVFLFFDLRKRVYEIYRDTISYSEGFLSKNYSLIPFENLSDSAVTQNIVDKIFGLYDVKLSCQGSAQEILFKNIRSGPAMSDQLDKLIAEKKTVGQPVSLSASAELSVSEADPRRSESSRSQARALDITFARKFKMDPLETYRFPFYIFLSFLAIFFLSLFFLLFGLFGSPSQDLSPALVFFLVVSSLAALATLVLTIFAYIRYRATNFEIRERSIHYRYNFLSSKNIDFDLEKVTGVMVKRSFIDVWFGNMNVHFWSIGAASSLIFANLKNEEGLIDAIIAKFGMKKEEAVYRIEAEFSPSEWLKSILPLAVTVFVLTIALVFLLAQFSLWVAFLLSLVVFGFSALVYLYQQEAMKRTKLVFFNTYAYCQKGWLWKSFYFVPYDSIKDIKTIRFPFSDEGNLVFNVAGETVVQTRDNKQISSYRFVMDFVSRIREKDELVDYILHKQPQAQELSDPKTEGQIKELSRISHESRPSLKNPLFLVFLGLLFVDLIIWSMNASLSSSSLPSCFLLSLLFLNLLAILIPLLVTIMISYRLDAYRVIKKEGVIYKRQTSVIYDKIDFIGTSAGLLNKIFGNGNIMVNTVGSSRTELTIRNIPDYKEFYKKLKERYERQ